MGQTWICSLSDGRLRRPVPRIIFDVTPLLLARSYPEKMNREVRLIKTQVPNAPSYRPAQLRATGHSSLGAGDKTVVLH